MEATSKAMHFSRTWASKRCKSRPRGWTPAASFCASTSSTKKRKSSLERHMTWISAGTIYRYFFTVLYSSIQFIPRKRRKSANMVERNWRTFAAKYRHAIGRNFRLWTNSHAGEKPANEWNGKALSNNFSGRASHLQKQSEQGIDEAKTQNHVAH